MKKLFTLLLVLMIVPNLATGQYKSKPDKPSFSKILGGDNKLRVGLLDPSKIHIAQSYSLSTFSAGGRNATIGLYTNTFTYQVSEPLEIKVKVGLINQFQNSFINNGANPNQALYGAEINYKPSEKFQLHFEYGPSVLSDYNYDRYSRYRY